MNEKSFSHPHTPCAGARSLLGRAVAEFSMIRPDDNIAAGVSGGKDSLYLLACMADLRRRSPKPFSLSAIMVDISGGGIDTDILKRFCLDLEIPLTVVEHPVLDIIEKRRETSPCSFCANMRGGILCSTAAESGAGVVAMGHNLDDAVETVLLNLFFAGRFRCFSPCSWRSRSNIRVIRPLVFIEEKKIAGEALRLKLPVTAIPCPHDPNSRRKQMKEIVASLERSVPDIRSQVLHALRHVRASDVWGTDEHTDGRLAQQT
ncbi:MAG: tRNA 2-thiocytidine biosynthesis TtcA family protein [Synergistota bacterium]|nr:tRNA 2-thiocytidine biosynthesis TtcA family protein [Synergistota bacterium]